MFIYYFSFTMFLNQLKRRDISWISDRGHKSHTAVLSMAVCVNFEDKTTYHSQSLIISEIMEWYVNIY